MYPHWSREECNKAYDDLDEVVARLSHENADLGRENRTITAERDALARTLATLGAAGITTGEDGAVRFHGLTGAEIDRRGAVVSEVRPAVRDINAFVAGWEATRDDTHATITVSRRLLQPFLGSAAALSIALAAAGGGADGEG